MRGAHSPEVTVLAPGPWFPAGITARSCGSFNFLAIPDGIEMPRLLEAWMRERRFGRRREPIERDNAGCRERALLVDFSTTWASPQFAVAKSVQGRR
jgi:hypothetical protein